MARVHVLGAGTPTPTPTRFGSSYVVEVAGEQLMVDCGPATTHKLVKGNMTLYYLRSDQIDLNRYVNKRIGVHGTLVDLSPELGARLITVSGAHILSD